MYYENLTHFLEIMMLPFTSPKRFSQRITETEMLNDSL